MKSGATNYGSVEITHSDSVFSRSTVSYPTTSKNENNCTAWEAASNQIAVVTGAGILSLPYAASAMGWSVLLLLFILTACFCYSYLLLVYSIEKVRLRLQGFNTPLVTLPTVDYATLGKEAFGPGGEKFVLIVLITELFLALVSFFINIGLNTHVIFPSIDVATAIFFSTCITLGLSFADMKILSKVTAFGNIMTIFTVLALALSGMFLPDDNTSSKVEQKMFDGRGIAVSLGVMAYCFGGHGAFPKIYQSMSNRKEVPITISTVAAVVFVLYAVIIALGYMYYGSSTMIPVTLNIGKDLQGNDLPSARLLSVFASLGLVSNIQATCPIIVVTITDMISTTFPNLVPSPSTTSSGLLPNSHSSSASASSVDVTTSSSSSSPHKYIFTILCFGAMIVSLFLRDDFLEVCGIIGSLVTIASSILLPIAFYHCLYPISSLPYYIILLHILLIALACCAMFVGLTSSICGISHSQSTLCSLTAPSNPSFSLS